MTDRVAMIVAELRKRLADIYGDRLERVILFGSQARGDATSESDFDVLVVLWGEVSPGKEILRTGEVASELSLQYDVTISRVFVSAECFHEEPTPFLSNVRREGIAV
ncbi:MAG TPA: nucleotidyltransferase domain-containing protein [Longimicrobiaceae bacterium]|nr:nucleotidyltransferase domain-containing protein [Longimicrobiaceae bacterium]